MDDIDWGDWLSSITSGINEKAGGDTSWLDEFDWSGALENLDFSGLDLSDVFGYVGEGGLGAPEDIVITGERPTDLAGFDFGTADEVYQGADTRTGFDFATADEVYQGSNLGTDPYEIDGMQGSREDTYEEDLKDQFWKNLITEEGDGAGTIVVTGKKPTEDSILTDEEHIRKDLDVDEDIKSILTDEEHTRQFDEDNIVKKILNAIKPSQDNALLYSLLGGLLGLLNRPKGADVATYKGGIPKYTATRGTPRSPTEGGRRPGGAGIGSLTGGVTYTKAAGGGLMGLAAGGNVRPARFLAGGTDGMADKIQTDIEGEQPARLSHGEFVIPADVVSHLGNGNSEAGADVLYDMMAQVRKARTGNPNQGRQINPRKYIPS